MSSAPPLPTVPTDWLVVINRLEANVFRSLAKGAAPQVFRAAPSLQGTGSRPAADEYLNGRERPRLPAFFEPLAGVLHGARRILIFGQTTPLGGEADAFIFWLRGNRPAIAGRIVASVLVELEQRGEAGWLARARDFYHKRTEAAAPETPVPATAERPPPR